jgi:hypothetical protein
LLAVVHELGHAIADARFRERGLLSRAAAEEYKRRRPDVKAAIDAYNSRVRSMGSQPTASEVAELEGLRTAITKDKAERDALFEEADRLARLLVASDRANVVKGRPVEKAFAAVLGVKRSSTRYGKSSPKEHFAECFTLHKTDPEALRRISAAAADWFASGQHVTIAGAALDP